MIKASRSLALAAAAVLAAGMAQAHEQVYFSLMDGPSEAPPNPSPGTGFAQVTIDFDLITMRVEATFQDLVGITSAAHIHAPTLVPGVGTAGVATMLPSFTGFPLGVSAGSMDTTFDMTLASSYNPAFITASGGTVGQAFNRLVLALDEGRAYFNIHTSAFAGGEIRGFPQLIPAPGAAALIGLGGLLATRRRRA